MEIIYISIKEEKASENYVVPISNFSDKRGESAFIIGLPCKVISKPYVKRSFNTDQYETVIDVISCITGIKYTIPKAWTVAFDTLEKANKSSKLRGIETPNIKKILGCAYWPKDNSYITDFRGNRVYLYHKECKLLSLPFDDITPSDSIQKFVLVEYQGKVYRTLWEEWCLYKDF